MKAFKEDRPKPAFAGKPQWRLEKSAERGRGVINKHVLLGIVVSNDVDVTPHEKEGSQTASTGVPMSGMGKAMRMTPRYTSPCL